VDQFRERTGQRPSIDKVHPDLRINIHIDRDQVSVALDTSGNSCTNVVEQRQYCANKRSFSSRCVVTFRLGWSAGFLDPMCGQEHS
jgi:putative N6-adenine-specific DNA methylase